MVRNSVVKYIEHDSVLIPMLPAVESGGIQDVSTESLLFFYFQVYIRVV